MLEREKAEIDREVFKLIHEMEEAEYDCNVFEHVEALTERLHSVPGVPVGSGEDHWN